MAAAQLSRQIRMNRDHRTALDYAPGVRVSLAWVRIAHPLGHSRRVHVDPHPIVNQVEVLATGAGVQNLGVVADKRYPPLLKPTRGEGPRGGGRYKCVCLVGGEVPSTLNPLPK